MAQSTKESDTWLSAIWLLVNTSVVNTLVGVLVRWSSQLAYYSK